MTIITNIFLIAHVAVTVKHLQWKYKVLMNKTIVLANKLKDFHSCMHYPTFAKNHTWFYIPSRILRSASERHLVVPSQRGSKSLSRTFSFTVPGCGMIFPPHPECWIPVNIQATTENSSLSTLLDFTLNLKTLFIFDFFHLSLLPLLAFTYFNNAWDLVLWALPLSVCLFKINRFMYSPIVSCFG